MPGSNGSQRNKSAQPHEQWPGQFFHHLPAAALKDFDSVKSMAAYRAGEVLFLEGEESRGIFLLYSGEVKLSISSGGGKTLILRIAQPGEMLGLMATLAGKPNEVTAEAFHPCRLAFLRREDFLRFIAKFPEAYCNVAMELSAHYQAACKQMRTMALARSTNEKLVRWLLDWSAKSIETKEATWVSLPLTHEEIAAFIGTSRETVTRVLSELKDRNLVALRGSTLMIPNRAALESLVSA